MFLIAAYLSVYEKPGQLPVSEVLMGRSRLGLMDIHNFFNPHVFEVRDSAIVTIQHLQEVIGPGSNGMISLTFGDLERPDQGHLLKNSVSVRDSAIVTIEHAQEMICCKSNGIISLTFGDLEKSDQGHLLKKQAFCARQRYSY